jgi:DNA-binding NarL/FixJ family response regulator
VSNAHIKAITAVMGRFEPLVGYGLEFVLGSDPHVRVLGTGLDDAELERFVVNQAPRVAIVGEAVDYGLLSRLKACQPATGIVVVASDPARLWGEMLVEFGATALTHNTPREAVLAAVRRAAAGEPTHSPPGGDCPPRMEPGESGLTDRENEVLAGLSEGRTNPEIAGALHISVRTVGTHVSMIFRKLGVQRRQQLIGMQVPRSR